MIFAGSRKETSLLLTVVLNRTSCSACRRIMIEIPIVNLFKGRETLKSSYEIWARESAGQNM